MSEYPDSYRHSKLLDACLGEKSKIKLLILDVDGVLTDGTKVYDQNHNPVYKTYRCKDFTAIKRFIAAGSKNDNYGVHLLFCSWISRIS